mmetsp:Transcript_5941/g.17004  ORF Transcript_5941/g.17004 Transcript_5941/m.17004 type:complete len:108 (-) Transcript_5941:723-1046(-)
MTDRISRRALQTAQRAAKWRSRMSADATEICLVRHGETSWNLEGRMQGQLQPGGAAPCWQLIQRHLLLGLAASRTDSSMHRRRHGSACLSGGSAEGAPPWMLSGSDL